MKRYLIAALVVVVFSWVPLYGGLWLYIDALLSQEGR